jgi:hypothetical protein
MMTRIDIQESAGKQIKAALWTAWRKTLVIAFTDGTYSCLYTEVDDDEGYMDEADFSPADVRNTDDIKRFIGAGVFTQEEHDAAIEAGRLARQKRLEQQERAQFERLKAKFATETK